jgi:hypothetical protein
LVSALACGAHWRTASRIAASRASSAAASASTSSTRPTSLASSASNLAAVSIMRRAAGEPVRLTIIGAIWAVGMPSCVSVSANFASAVASTKSPAAASPSPPAIAAPSTIMTVTGGNASTA